MNIVTCKPVVWITGIVGKWCHLYFKLMIYSVITTIVALLVFVTDILLSMLAYLTAGLPVIYEFKFIYNGVCFDYA